ncbi:MAG: M28 family peptidase [Candidatus Latescibacteria bacterium]|nr:M28 family peptidase [Candidatus Latescibacterota bacterium]
MRFGVPFAIFVAAVSVALATGDSPSESTYLSRVRQLTFEGKRAGEGYFSPDGKRFVFQAEREKDNPFYQIYMLSLETGDVHRVSNGTGKTTCAYFDPKNERVIFASTHLDPDAAAKQKMEIDNRAAGKQRRYAWDYDETYDVFSTKFDGSDAKRLTDAPGYDAECSFSPDGAWIVFSSNRNHYNRTNELTEKEAEKAAVDLSYFADIFVMRADGTGVEQLTSEPGYDGGPFFTPDGSRIVWRRFSEDGTIANVFTMKPDGSDVVQVTDFGAMSWAPYFHPSGEYVIFTANKMGFENFELYMVDAHGEKDPVRVTYTDGFDGLPVFSPDGKQLAWTSNRTSDKTSQIFIADWNHEAARAALSRGFSRMDHTGVDGGRATYRAPLERSASGANVSFSPEIRASDLKNDVSVLASDDMEGRMTGSKGEQACADYLAKRFRDMGVMPFDEKAGYFQTFPFTSGVKVVTKDNRLTLKTGEKTRTLKVEEDFRPLAFSENATVEGPVAFAGFGLKTPGTGAYDSYGDLDVKDKVVLVLNYVPEGVEMDRRMELNMYAGARYKAMIAREKGAKALLFVTGPNSPNAGALSKLGFDQSMSGSGIPVASVSGTVADEMLKGHNQTLKEVQDALDVENPHAVGTFDLPGVTVSLTTKIEREMGEGRNVIAHLPAFEKKDAPVIVIGAHYDHLGHGEDNSLARKGEEGQIHNGADDNASGTSTMMEIAHALSDMRGRHPDLFPYEIVFAAWSGEELGIIGSNYFVEHPLVPKERIVAYVNFDMVGRIKDNTLIVQGVGSSDAWKGLVEKNNVPVGFNAKLDDDPYLPTDVTAFYPKGIPVLAFFSGNHEDYHRPTDDVETLNYDDMARVAKLVTNLTIDLMKRDAPPAYVKVAPTSAHQGSRASMRVYLGTIPDYAPGEIEGIKLSGVKAGGPAEKAGLQGGDVIVECAGKAIKNIYDYTYAMDALKIGEAVPIVVVRDGKRVTLTIVPEARQ